MRYFEFGTPVVSQRDRGRSLDFLDLFAAQHFPLTENCWWPLLPDLFPL